MVALVGFRWLNARCRLGAHKGPTSIIFVQMRNSSCELMLRTWWLTTTEGIGVADASTPLIPKGLCASQLPMSRLSQLLPLVFGIVKR